MSWGISSTARLTMTVKNFDGKVPHAVELDEADLALLAAIAEHTDLAAESLENYRFRQGIERVIELGRKANVYFDAKAPWVTRKTDLARTGTTLYVCCQVVKAFAHLLAPFLPEGAAKLGGILGVTLPQGGPDGGEDGWESAKAPLHAGHPLNTPQVLFPKLDPDVITQLAEEHQQGRAS
jgi:methionyl-tRNA synthetase